MVNFNSKLYCAYLSLLGYKKVPLRDTRGILNSSNNFKYYKESVLHRSSKTILPSGTKIIYKVDDMDNYSKLDTIKETKIVKKFCGEIIKSVREIGNNAGRIITKKPWEIIPQAFLNIIHI